jgi:hypothetical protein
MSCWITAVAAFMLGGVFGIIGMAIIAHDNNDRRAR